LLLLEPYPKGKVPSQWESQGATTGKPPIVTSVALPLALRLRRDFLT